MALPSRYTPSYRKEQAVLAKKVECPVCEARPGEVCMKPDGSSTQEHTERWQRATLERLQ